MNDVGTFKRASPPTPSPPPTKRTKTEYHDYKLYNTSLPLPLTASHGVERIPFHPFLNPNRLSSHHLAQLTTERIHVLRGQGRRVVGLPVVLNDGIVLNWARDEPSSVNGVRLHKIEDNDPQCAALIALHRDEKRSSATSAGFGSGTSAADAIVINSDDDTGGVSGTSAADAIVIEYEDVVTSLSRPDTPREPPVNHEVLTDGRDAVDLSDSDTELLSSVHPENQVEDNPQDLGHSLLTSQMDDPNVPSNLFPRRALTKDEDAVTLSGLCDDSASSTTSDSGAHTTDKEGRSAEDVDCSRISAGQAKPLSLPSLQPIRELLARVGRREAPLQRTIITLEVPKEPPGERCLEETPTITGSKSGEEIGCPASDPQLKRVHLPKTDYGRARRLLTPESPDLPMVAVTMRGDCHFIERKKKYRISGYSLPNPGVFRHVGDVCMVGNTAVLGCDKGAHQISFLSVAGRPRMIDVTWSPHSSGPRYQDTQKRGVSRLATIHAEDGHIKFLSGGYDGTVYEWSASTEKLNEPRSRKVVTHGGSIMALAYRNRDRSVVASAQKKLHITDLNRCKTMTHLVSNDIQQIHIHPQAAYITLLEVRHLDRQIQLYDSRKGDFHSEPCLSFGHRSENGKFSGIHTRGSVHLVHFAMASEENGVLLWDFRNCKRAVIERRFRQAEKVVHTIFADSDIATFGQGIVTFFEDYLAQ